MKLFFFFFFIFFSFGCIPNWVAADLGVGSPPSSPFGFYGTAAAVLRPKLQTHHKSGLSASFEWHKNCGNTRMWDVRCSSMILSVLNPFTCRASLHLPWQRRHRVYFEHKGNGPLHLLKPVTTLCGASSGGRISCTHSLRGNGSLCPPFGGCTCRKVVDPFSCTIYSLPPFDFGLKACKEPLKFEITSEIAFDYIKYLLFYHH